MKLPALRRRRHIPRGQALVEFALILPLLMLLTLMAIDFGRVYYSYIQIRNAAREAANYAAFSPTDSAGMMAAALRETNTQAQAGETPIVIPSPVCKDAAGTVIDCVDATTGGDGPGNTVTVTVQEDFSFFTPFINGFWNNAFVMSASSSSTIYGFVTGGGGTPPAGCGGPTAAFTVLAAESSLEITVNPSSSTPTSGVCTISGYNWTWGDGNTDVGSATGSTHTYAASGTYVVTLEVTNQGGSATISHNVTVPAPPIPPVCAPPVANFSWTSSGKTRTYHDTSTVPDPVNCPITNWLWTFTDLGTQSNAQNPAPQTYGNNSAHPVTLQVTNAGGTSTRTYNT
jgi:Flp pilus assembly protein TadG